MEKTIRIPRSLSVRAAGILKGFLNKVPTDRLGCHKESGFMEIMTHPFFKTIEWEAVSYSSFVFNIGNQILIYTLKSYEIRIRYDIIHAIGINIDKMRFHDLSFKRCITR